MLNFIKNNKLVFAFLLVSILLLPLSISTPAESDRVAVVTSVGLDKVDGGIEVSVNTIVPNSGQAGGPGGADGTVKTVSAVGENVSSAFANVTLVLGKFPGLAHCDSIILNKNLFSENVLEYLDFFVRTNNLTSNAALMVAENTAKEVVETAAAQKGLSAVSISELLLLNNEYALSKNSNIDEFYLKTFSPSKTATLPLITVGDSNKDNKEVNGDSAKAGESEGKAESGGGLTESSNQSGNGSPQKIIKNEGKGVIVKSGKIVCEVAGKNMSGINLISKATKRGHIEAKNVNALGFNNANLTFEIYNKKAGLKGEFVNGKPVVTYTINLVLKLEEVKQKSLNINSLKTTKNYVEGEIKQNLVETATENINAIIETAKSVNADVFEVYDYFNKFHNKKWKNFLNTLENKEEYLNHIQFNINIKLQGKI